MSKPITIVKNDGKKEVFNPDKLIHSLKRSGAKEDVVKKVLDHVEEELEDGMSTKTIYDHAYFLLHKLEKPLAARYSLKRAIADLGPTGFPFEDYMAEIFKTRGFQTLTDQMILGACVTHEVDVIAWNDQKLIMCEVKFHNDTAGKTDLKIALYVKARMEDLKPNVFDYGKPRHLDEGWLITNTKFTETAIHYGECNDLKMVSWNYPKQGNLHELIEDGDLHPLTCLTTLNGSEKQQLLSQNIILCRDLRNDHSLLTNLHISGDKLKEVLQEISYLTNS